MNANASTTPAGPTEIDATQAADAAGGTTCSAEELTSLSGSLTQIYDNLVDFTSHVIGRVAGE